ncbi:hypothetical protein [Providencia alcalifaciens]|uniref:hypothetical protein n=1 Tax=Providencia alcalifaciens TaxID=126385 RepID=UPI000448A58F|nr:hypothetical protein [Providencia alcalifaciens]EUD07276.1 hypothetical protein HMPREF1564_3844 [Providencia alcalifaciens R90-1475]
MKIIYSLLFISAFSHAFSVDSMIKYSNKEDYFLITGNNQNKREYINVTISELLYKKDAPPREINYTAKNIEDWPILIDPAEIIVDSGEQVKVKITNNSKPNNDRIFGITFTPDIQNNKELHDYNLDFGFKTWYIIPGNTPMEGTLTAQKGIKNGEYIISNQTNKIVEVKLNYCNNKNETNCKGQLITAPYTEKKIHLDKKQKNIMIDFYLGYNDKKEPIKRIKI